MNSKSSHNSSALKVKANVIRTAQITDEIEIAWAQIRSSHVDYDSPYFSLDFVRAVDQIRSNVEIAVIRSQADQIIGFLPFQRMGHRKAEPVGGRLNDLHGIMSYPGLNFSTPNVLAQCRLKSFQFHSSPSCLSDSLSDFVFRYQGTHQIDLSSGWEPYRAWIRKHSSTVKRQGQKTRALEKTGEVEFEFDCLDPDALEELIALKRAKYQRTNTFDILSVKWASELLRKIHLSSTGDLQGILSVIRLDGKMIAGHFGMTSGDMLHYWFPTFDVNFSRYSPGTELILRVAQSAAEKGFTTIDFGYGDDAYKFKFCNVTTPAICGRVESNPISFQMAKCRFHVRNSLKDIPSLAPAKAILRTVFPGFGQWNFK